MKTSHQLRVLADDIENLEQNKTLKKKEVWEAINEIHIKLIKILESDLFSNL